MVSRLKGEKSEGGCEASFLAGETSGLTNPIPEPCTLKIRGVCAIEYDSLEPDQMHKREHGSRVRIASTGFYAPEKVLTNADLVKMVDTTDEWIVSRSGIKERRARPAEQGDP